MARKHTTLAKSKVLEYSEVLSTSIPIGATVYEVSTLPSPDTSKQYLFLTTSNKYYRLTAEKPTQYAESTNESGILMGEPAINVASGYECIFAHTYSPDSASVTNDGLSVYKPITERIQLNTGSMYTPTAQAVNDFVVPKYDNTYTTATPSIIIEENTVYWCTNANVTLVTLNISNMVTGPKTRKSVVYFHTSRDGEPVLNITGDNAETMYFGNTVLYSDKDYVITVKDNSVFIMDDGIGDYSSLTNKPSLSTTSTTALSTNPNETISAKINLHKVAKTGTYSDLIGTPTIPSAPGTLDTTATTAQATSASEALSGTVTLHKVAKTGTYSDLIGTPTIPSAPGTLDTTATTAQATSASETLSGSVTLHKIAKTGTYSDLIGRPTIPSAPGTLDTTNEDSLETSASEALSGSINLHKVSKTGDYNDLLYNIEAGTNISITNTHLPSTFRELDYISNGSGTRVNTGHTPSVDNIKVEIVVKPTSGVWRIFQSGGNDSNTCGFFGLQNDYTIKWIHRGNTVVTSSMLRNTNHYMLMRATAVSGSVELYVKDLVTGDEATNTGTYTFGSGYPIQFSLFGSAAGLYSPAGACVASLKFWIDDELKCDYVPCIRISNNTVGFYNKVTGSFITEYSGTLNAGTVAKNNVINVTGLSTVATTGDYDDLSNKPVIPSAPGTLDTTATTAQATSASEALSGSVTLHKVAKTGTYSDLIGTPTIPTPITIYSGTSAPNPGIGSDGDIYIQTTV